MEAPHHSLARDAKTRRPGGSRELVAVFVLVVRPEFRYHPLDHDGHEACATSEQQRYACFLSHHFPLREHPAGALVHANHSSEACPPAGFHNLVTALTCNVMGERKPVLVHHVTGRTAGNTLRPISRSAHLRISRKTGGASLLLVP